MGDPGTDCDEWVADCRLRSTIELLAHTWDPVVLAALSQGPRRRRELKKTIGGISDKVLTEALNRLKANGLITRRSYNEAPPRVVYGLTELGQTLIEGPMRALAEWTIDHGDELLEIQDR